MNQLPPIVSARAPAAGRAIYGRQFNPEITLKAR